MKETDMTTPVVHMIGQGHLDPVWLWRWAEGRAEALATSQSAVDRLREYPDFHFVRGEAQVYQWIEQDDPALFAAIQQLIREGRWHLVNGMVIQPDMNLPGGESFVRQVLLGKAYMAEKSCVGPRQPQTPAAGTTTAAPHTLENDLIRVQLDPASGNIVSCIDKESGCEWVGAGGWNVPEVVDDPSDTWTHRLAGYGAASDAFGEPAFTVIEEGPLQASLLVERRFGPSVWLQQLSLRQGEPEIVLRNWLNWQGRWTLLKLAFDVAVTEPAAAHDVPFGWIERPVDGREAPTQM
jgi:alpha-mannosidase